MNRYRYRLLVPFLSIIMVVPACSPGVEKQDADLSKQKAEIRDKLIIAGNKIDIRLAQITGEMEQVTEEVSGIADARVDSLRELKSEIDMTIDSLERTGKNHWDLLQSHAEELVQKVDRITGGSAEQISEGY